MAEVNNDKQSDGVVSVSEDVVSQDEEESGSIGSVSSVAETDRKVSVADSLLSISKPSLLPTNPSSSSPPSSSGTTNKLTLNHHASHLYTIEAILGLKNHHANGIHFYLCQNLLERY